MAMAVPVRGMSLLWIRKGIPRNLEDSRAEKKGNILDTARVIFERSERTGGKSEQCDGMAGARTKWSLGGGKPGEARRARMPWEGFDRQPQEHVSGEPQVLPARGKRDDSGEKNFPSSQGMLGFI